jgi:hypothetical protein
MKASAAKKSRPWARKKIVNASSVRFSLLPITHDLPVAKNCRDRAIATESEKVTTKTRLRFRLALLHHDRGRSSGH